jgi:hypothetical protein
VVFHGIGYLSRYFLKYFKGLDIPVMLTPHSGHTDPLRILVKKIS